ncbi:MAG: 2-hydroxyacyl-CoA dehydratase [Acidimicrobiales bacterium]
MENDELGPMATKAFDPVGYAAGVSAGGRLLVGTIGFDVPHEILVAAGMHPIRLRGDPSVDEASKVALSGMALDPVATSHVIRFMSGNYEALDYLVIAHDTAMNAKLFFVLRELARLGELPARPEFAFVDLRHMERASTDRYNHNQLRQFVELAGGWSGGEIAEGRLREAIAICNRSRHLLQTFQSVRSGHDARFSGPEALAVFGAAQVVEQLEFQSSLTTLLGKAGDREALSGVRLFVSGSNLEDATAYELIEQAGGLIVGEDHDFGQRSFAGLVPESGEALEGLAMAYRSMPPAGAWGSLGSRANYTAHAAGQVKVRGVLSIVYEHDTALEWGWQQTRRALADAGVEARRHTISWGRPPERGPFEALVSSFGDEADK